MEKEKKEKHYRRKDEGSKKWVFKYVDEKVKEYKRFWYKDKASVIKFIYHFFGDCGIGRRNNEMIEEYLTITNKSQRIINQII